ncbi:ankyrin-2-like [Trichogramma pretiosum]|uniref:ankyrin-2-like n=1 Tax=Trichogramma pretiosum TaxID=7493 RepID=UPI000C71B74E|nr:ankyrin-2-like [Trichogramma pretiosum]
MSGHYDCVYDSVDWSSAGDYLYRERLLKNWTMTDCDDDDDEACRAQLQTLKSLRDEVRNWDFEFDRLELLDRLYPLVKDWKGRLPNLRDVFRDDEIERLLLQAAKNYERSRYNYRGQVFIKFVACTGYRNEPEPDLSRSRRATTALHWAATHDHHAVIHNLFEIYGRFDVNHTDETGFSHFHAACFLGRDDLVRKYLEAGQDPQCRAERVGSTRFAPPLHWAVLRGHAKVAELLVRAGADPNAVNDHDGWTPLHVVCKWTRDDAELVKTFFRINDEQQRMLQVDARDKLGRTPLQWAVARDLRATAAYLLRRRADPNLADNNGWTPLHILCHRNNNDFLRAFFEINEETNREVRIDAANHLGKTPLHLAVEYGHEDLIGLLLKKGANPNLGDKDGWTPLHMMCKKRDLSRFTTIFFETCREIDRRVEIDAVDKLDRTPLQWAVASLFPNVVDALLDQGADLASFVFPSDGYFGEEFDSHYPQLWIKSKLRLVSRALDVVERLERRGYKLSRNDALTVMKLFAKRELFVDSERFENGRNDEIFASQAKSLMMNSSLSLYDLINLPLEQAVKSFTIADYLGFERTDYKYGQLPRVLGCDTYLCEILSRSFFRRWTLDAFWSLTRYRLPILCCTIIVDNLMNEDLLKVCLAAEIYAYGQS